MAVGALIGAYQEDDSGGLRALLPLAGRTLIEYQARCVAAAGAAPIVVLVERVPPALQEAFERLRLDGLNIVPVSDGREAATRFDAGSHILLVGDGVAPPAELLVQLGDEADSTIAVVPDDDEHKEFERIDATSRWAGAALVDSRTLGATAAMLGDWDLQSTLLRKAIQDGALRVQVAPGAEPLLAQDADSLAGFERTLIVASRGARSDWASRYVLAPLEDFATERLMETAVRPQWLVWSALLLTAASAVAFTRGWLWPALSLLIVSTPLDIVARRLGALRLRPLSTKALSLRLLWPLAGLALLAIGWWLSRHGSGWGAMFAAVTAAAFAEAARIEQGNADVPGQLWLFSRRNAILGVIPFALTAAWASALVALALYAAISFFYVQYVRHRIAVN